MNEDTVKDVFSSVEPKTLHEDFNLFEERLTVLPTCFDLY